ncbi:unnamed protein product [Phytophthora fragariaefolia]|uniref:Unnamed protein product n=1 Tax=Phytophthora fragariaefolia TaxID=1490495 RepID=A0A9W6TT90_9STRA|nr:unnamed protein product [Phytophthora fragariaefolia]
MTSSDDEPIAHMEEESQYLETTTPVPATAVEELADDTNFGGTIGVKGELYLSVDKDEYRAGDLVTGRITVLVSEPLQCRGGCWLLPCQERLLTTVLMAVQHWCAPLSARRSRSGKTAVITTRDVIRSFAKRCRGWSLWDLSLPNPYDIGEYIYPLTYTLPTDLPGVVNVQSLDGDVSALHATIKYTFTATIKVQGRFVSDLEASTEVTVRSNPLPPIEVHSVERTISKELRWFGCLRRGTSHLALSMPRDVFTLGESPIVECFVNNHTASVGVEQVRIQLIQKVSLRHPNGKEDMCARPVAEAKCPGPKHGDMLECPVQLNLDDKVHFPSVTGSFLSCSYTVALICEYSMLIDPVTIELPVTILPTARASSTGSTLTDLAASIMSNASGR